MSASKINKGLIIEGMYTQYSKQLRFTLGANSKFKIQIPTKLDAICFIVYNMYVFVLLIYKGVKLS